MNYRWSETWEQSFLAQLYLGRFAWDLLLDFPTASDTEKSAFLRIQSQLNESLKSVDPEAVEINRTLPEEFLHKIRKTDLNKLQIPKQDGGPGLSTFQTFQLLVRAYEHCIPVGFCITGTLAFGASSIIEALPDGPLRKKIVELTKQGAISGWADTEPEGAANRYPATIASLSEDGQSYVLNGVKAYINNASIADNLLVSCVVKGDSSNRVRMILVDCNSPGVKRLGVHEMMGLRGQQVAAIRFENAQIPAENMVNVDEAHWRDNPFIEPLTSLGRFYSLFAASTALSRNCFRWTHQAGEHRIVDGSPLSTYEAFRSQVTATESELFMLESVAIWTLEGMNPASISERWWELFAAKNLGTLTAARVVDRTVSLLGAQGYDSLQSKKNLNLGLDLNQAERCFRDARGLRISGGVDFLVDAKSTRQWLYTFFYNPDFHVPTPAKNQLPQPDARLTSQNQLHFTSIGQAIERLYETTLFLRSRFESLQELSQHQCLLISMAALARELYSMSVCLARAAHLKEEKAQNLAAAFCEAAEDRICSEFRHLERLVSRI